MLKPPADVAPEVLFRRLIGWPRPSVDIEHRIGLAPGVALRVQALTAAEMLGSGLEVAASSLLIGNRPAFRSPADVGGLSSKELEKLLEAIAAGLGKCSPVEGRSDAKEWQEALLEGAKHHSNRRDAYVLGSQVEAIGSIIVDRPERYWGVPPRELVDAHRFVYLAARDYFFSCHAKTK